MMREINELRSHHGALDSAQARHLRSLLNRYKKYFIDLGMTVKEFFDWMNRLQPSPGDGDDGGYYEPPYDPWNPNPTPIIGQGGLVSRFLASPATVAAHGGQAAMAAYPIPRIPPSYAKSSRESRDIRVTVDGTGLHPYIQRVVASTLMEIERNR
jgi:hypothetical protein